MKMFDVQFTSQPEKFLKKAEKQLAIRIVERIEKLRGEPFPSDVKRVVNKKEKIFRIRLGDYRIQYSVFYDKNLIIVTDIDKRPRAY